MACRRTPSAPSRKPTMAISGSAPTKDWRASTATSSSSSTKTTATCPSNSITALAAAPTARSGSAPPSGLTSYRDRHFRTYTTRDGLPDEGIAALLTDHAGALWVVAGIQLSRFEAGKFTQFAPGTDIPLDTVRAVTRRPAAQSLGGRLRGRRGTARRPLRTRCRRRPFDGDLAATCCPIARTISGSRGNGPVRAVPRWQPSQVSARATVCPIPSCVRCGRIATAISGPAPTAAQPAGERPLRSRGRRRPSRPGLGALHFRGSRRKSVGGDEQRTEPLPRRHLHRLHARATACLATSPTTVFQDRKGRIWVGFHDFGLGLFDRAGFKVFTTATDCPSNEIFSIREARDGDLLVATREGLSRVCTTAAFSTYVPPDPLGAADRVRRPGRLARRSCGWRRPAGLTLCCGKDIPQRGSGRPHAEHLRGDARRGARRRHLGGHLRQGPVAHAEAISRAIHHRRRPFERPDSFPVTRMATARSGSAPSAAASTPCATARFHAIRRATAC